MKDLTLPPGDWAPCPDAPDYFMVSRKGELYSLRSNRIVSQNVVGNGYLAHVTKIGGRHGVNVVLKTHIQVAKAFHPNPENKPEMNHKNGIKSCNEDWNVEWSTRRENHEHAVEHGLFSCINDHRGQRSPKMTGMEIRELLENPSGSLKQCAEEYNVDRKTIQNIRSNPARYLAMTLTKR